MASSLFLLPVATPRAQAVFGTRAHRLPLVAARARQKSGLSAAGYPLASGLGSVALQIRVIHNPKTFATLAFQQNTSAAIAETHKMPLHLQQNIGPKTKLYVWRIEETFEDLFDEIDLTDWNIVRVMSMKSEQHKRGFLSVRKLFQAAGYTDFDVTYDKTGKPHLGDGHHISISHSHGFSAIIVSDVTVGIDLELMRDKITRIADKFTSEEEEAYLDRDAPDYVSKLTVIWGVKEAIFKIRNEIGISFKDHITTFAFDVDSGQATARLDFENVNRHFDVKFQYVEDHMLVYAFETSNKSSL